MKTVFVGLSGGVDSAVSAALLKREGYRVIGCFIKIWRPEFIDCPMSRDRLDAMRVCAALEIPFTEIDLSHEYKKTVIDEMVSNYERGITPNPDVLCNRHIKFGAFAKWAFENGAEYIATGHYAQIKNGALYRGKDANKDQSYFLAQVSQDLLERIVFPIGGLLKTDVRAKAMSLGLPVAAKKDSQGLCFVGDITLRDFLSHYITLEKGDVLDESGAVIGEHEGAALYTLGERHGFRTTTHHSKEVPHYVIGIDTKNNAIRVSRDRDRAKRRAVVLRDMQWFDTTKTKLLAQARYREQPVPCTVEGTTVLFDEEHLAPPGQTLALYDGDKLVGSGVIELTHRERGVDYKG